MIKKLTEKELKEKYKKEVPTDTSIKSIRIYDLFHREDINTIEEKFDKLIDEYSDKTSLRQYFETDEDPHSGWSVYLYSDHKQSFKSFKAREQKSYEWYLNKELERATHFTDIIDDMSDEDCMKFMDKLKLKVKKV